MGNGGREWDGESDPGIGLRQGRPGGNKKGLRNANSNERSRGCSLLHGQDIETVLNNGWRLVAVGGWWLVVGGGGRLAVGSGWRLVVGGWRRWAVGGR